MPLIIIIYSDAYHYYHLRCPCQTILPTRGRVSAVNRTSISACLRILNINSFKVTCGACNFALASKNWLPITSHDFVETLSGQPTICEVWWRRVYLGAWTEWPHATGHVRGKFDRRHIFSVNVETKTDKIDERIPVARCAPQGRRTGASVRIVSAHVVATSDPEMRENADCAAWVANLH